ncbi:MAB_1171c family putative transporter [Lentzea sp. NPDC005914]|uniref:MAB_1171c family putative transporter n=1 Tax=Lentzea sp. NPDC005914 TaxID=3154572 RepID=UPI0033E038D6
MTVLLDPTVISSTVATLCALYLMFRVVQKPGNLALRAAWLGTQSFAFSLCLGLLNYGAEATRPVSSTTRFIGTTQHMLAMIGIYLAFCAYVFMAYTRDDAVKRVRWHGTALLVVLVVALVPAIAASPEDFTASHVSDHANGPVSSIYLVVFIGYLAVMVGAAALLAWKWSRLADEPWIRRGLVMGTIGYVLAAGYCAVRTALIVLDLIDRPILIKDGAVTGWLITASLPFVVVGITVPGWGPRLAAALRWWAMQRTHRRLYPLWSALTSAHPHVRMSIGPSRLGGWTLRRFNRPWLAHWLDEKWAVEDLSLRLHLRVVQIWDARRALLDHCDAADYDRALDDPRLRRRRPDVRAAFAEAAMLAAGLRRHQAGERPLRTGGHPVPDGAATADLAANVTWLRHVAAGLELR